MPYIVKDQTGKMVGQPEGNDLISEEEILATLPVGYTVERVARKDVKNYFFPPKIHMVRSPNERIGKLEKEKEALYEYLEEELKKPKGELSQKIKNKLEGT